MFILRWVAEMNEFCGLVNITLGRSPEGEFLVSRRETMKLLHRGWVVAHSVLPILECPTLDQQSPYCTGHTF